MTGSQEALASSRLAILILRPSKLIAGERNPRDARPRLEMFEAGLIEDEAGRTLDKRVQA